MNFQLLKTRKNLICLFIFILTSVIFYLPGFEGKILWGQDTSKITFPFSYFLDQSIKNGRLETWNPLIYFGFPLGAEQGQYGIVYPLNLLHTLFPFALTITILGIIHFTIAGFSTYLYCRFLHLRYMPSVFAGLAYMFNGFIIAHDQYPTHIYAYAWLPLIFLFITIGIQNKRLKDFVIAGVFLGLQALSGHPNIFIITIIGSFFYLLILGYSDFLQLLKAWFLMTGSFIITALPYLWQLKTLLPLSNRAQGVDFLDATNSSLHFFDLINFISPHFFFTNLAQSWHYATVWHRFGYWGQIETTGFVGITTIILAIAAFNRQKIKQKLPLLGLLIISLLIAFGRNTFLYETLFYKLPILNGLRAPGKFLLLTDFSLVVLAALGFDYLIYIKDRKSLNIKIMPIILLVSIILMLFWMRFDSSNPNSTLTNYIQNTYSLDGFFNNKTDISTLVQKSVAQHTSFPLVVSFLLLIILIIYKFFKTKLIVIIIPLILLVEVYNFVKPINLWVAWQDMLHLPNETISFLDKQLGKQYRVYTYTDFWSDLMPDQLVPCQVMEANGFTSLYLTRFSNWQNLAMSTKRENLFRMGSIKYIYRDYKLFEINNPLPRIFLATNWNLVDSESEALEAIRANTFNPEIPIVETIINPANKPIEGQIIPLQLNKEAYDSMSLNMESDSGGLLVFNDSNYLGWKAFIDGRDIPILQTNYLFKGLFVPEGKHTVELLYIPNFWWPSIIISWGWILIVFARSKLNTKSI